MFRIKPSHKARLTRQSILHLIRALLLALTMAWSLTLAAEIKLDTHELDKIRKETGVAALAVVLVERNGSVLNYQTGVREWGGAAVDAHSVFRMGSVSKMFTGLTLLKAQEHGVLDLDTPIRNYLPANALKTSYENPWEQEQALTSAHLMEHTAGWFDMSGLEFNHSDAKPLSLAEALALRPESRLSHWPPGLHSEYSNSGAGLAAYVLEQAAQKAGIQQNFEQLAKRWVFEPLGMPSAEYQLTAAVKQHLVQGYDRDRKTEIPYWHIVFRPAGGLNVLPSDMAGMLSMLLNRGRVDDKVFLSPQQLERFEYPQTTLAARSGLRFGYGLGIYQSQIDGHTLFNHGGDADGYLSHLAYSPSSGRGYYAVVTAFDSRILGRVKDLLNAWVSKPLQPVKAPVEYALNESEYQSLVGTYYRASTRFPRANWQQQALRIRYRDGRLYTQEGNGRQRPLLAVNAQHFRRPWETEATAALMQRADGRVVLQGNMGNWVKPAP